MAYRTTPEVRPRTLAFLHDTPKTIGVPLLWILSWGVFAAFFSSNPIGQARCDRSMCHFGDAAVPLERVVRLESQGDETKRVAAKLDDGTTIPITSMYTSFDGDQKKAMIAGFDRFRRSSDPYWEASYGTGGRWIGRVLWWLMLAMLAGWIATRRRTRLLVRGDALRVDQGYWYRPKTTELEIHRIAHVRSDERGLRLELDDGSRTILQASAPPPERVGMVCDLLGKSD